MQRQRLLALFPGSMSTFSLPLAVAGLAKGVWGGGYTSATQQQAGAFLGPQVQEGLSSWARFARVIAVCPTPNLCSQRSPPPPPPGVRVRSLPECCGINHMPFSAVGCRPSAFPCSSTAVGHCPIAVGYHPNTILCAVTHFPFLFSMRGLPDASVYLLASSGHPTVSPGFSLTVHCDGGPCSSMLHPSPLSLSLCCPQEVLEAARTMGEAVGLPPTAVAQQMFARWDDSDATEDGESFVADYSEFRELTMQTIRNLATQLHRNPVTYSRPKTVVKVWLL